jgi:putative ABC transport system permease protein
MPLLSLLLFAFPKAFRERLGRPLLQTLMTDCRTASGRISPWRLTSGALDLVRAGLAERVRLARDRRRPARAESASRLWQLRGLSRELGQARRSLVGRPGLALTVFLTLALGLAVNTAVFAVVSGVLVRDLPYRDPGRLAFMWTKLDWIGVPRAWVAGPHIDRLRHDAKTLDAIVPLRTASWQLTGAGAPQLVRVGLSDTTLFNVLGVRPMLGRFYVPGDESRNVVVLGQALWRQQFGGDPSAIGRTVELAGRPTEVIGVLPPDFRFLVHASLGDPTRVDMWAPADWQLSKMSDTQFAFAALVRVKAGRSLRDAQAELDTIGAEIDRTRFKSRGFGWRLAGVQADLVKKTRPALLLVATAAGAVLLIVCTNVAGLMLVKNAGRRREFAVRIALGASRAQIVRLVILECVALSLVAGMAGLALAWVAVRAVVTSRLLPLPRLGDVHMDWRVVSFTLAASLVTGLVFGLLPAIRTTRADGSASLGDAARGSSGRTGRLRAWLVAAELATAVVLLTAALLLFRSYEAIRSVDPGFDGRGVLVANITLDMGRYPKEAQAIALHQQLSERLALVPGVSAVGASTSAPLAGDTDQSSVRLADGRPMPGTTDGALTADIIRTTPGYFRAMGIPVVHGRDFSWQDRADAQPVAVVDERFARAAWPDGHAVGRLLSVDGGKPLTVVGVVRHARQYHIDADDREQLYRPYAQDTTLGLTLAIRTVGDPDRLVDPLRRILGDLDAKQPIAEVTTMADVVDQTLVDRRVQLHVLGAFAVGALLLSAIGIYGVLAALVSDRTREIGIRMALGADSGSVRRLVLGQTLWFTACGLAIGMVGALAASRSLAHFLFAVSARDPASLLATVGLVSVATLTASYVPVRRATSIDPAAALRRP